MKMGLGTCLLTIMILNAIIVIQAQAPQSIQPSTSVSAQHKQGSQTSAAKPQQKQQLTKQGTIEIDNSKQVKVLPQPTQQLQQKIINKNEQIQIFENKDVDGNRIDPLTQTIIQHQQEQAEQKEEHEKQKKLNSWVAKQMAQLSQTNQIKTHQIFAFQIGDQALFKWDPSNNSHKSLSFVVQVFAEDRGTFFFPDNPQQQNYIQVFAQPDVKSMFVNLGKVYIKKMFMINFFNDYQILKFKNHYERRMFIQINLQSTKFIPQQALDDDDLKIPAQKMKSILQQLQQTEKKREKTYRQEWNFRDRQEHHQSEMLILTGLQLIVIMGTAFVQIYCIKNLFDNRLIV